MTGENIISFELYLIRHGQTYGNTGDWPPDTTEAEHKDPGLSPEGDRQAQLLGERFSIYPFDAIYASPLRRAVVTAEHIRSRQPESGAKALRILPILTECGADGDYDGLTWDELARVSPGAAPAAEVDPDAPRVFATKGWDDTRQWARGKQVIEYLFRHHGHGDKVAVVAHAAFNTFITHAALGLDPTKVIFDPHFINTGVTKIVFFEPGTGRYGLDILLVSLNDLSHLQSEFPRLSLDPTYI